MPPSATAPEDTVSVTIELRATVATKQKAASAHDVKRILDEALDLAKTVGDALPEGGKVTGFVKIGKQAFPL